MTHHTKEFLLNVIDQQEQDNFLIFKKPPLISFGPRSDENGERHDLKSAKNKLSRIVKSNQQRDELLLSMSAIYCNFPNPMWNDEMATTAHDLIPDQKTDWQILLAGCAFLWAHDRDKKNKYGKDFDAVVNAAIQQSGQLSPKDAHYISAILAETRPRILHWKNDNPGVDLFEKAESDVNNFAINKTIATSVSDVPLKAAPVLEQAITDSRQTRASLMKSYFNSNENFMLQNMKVKEPKKNFFQKIFNS